MTRDKKINEITAICVRANPDIVEEAGKSKPVTRPIYFDDVMEAIRNQAFLGVIVKTAPAMSLLCDQIAAR